MGVRSVVWCQVGFGLLIPLFLQTTGVFSTFWLIENGVYKGLFYQRLADGSVHLEVLDQATLGLQVTAVILLLFCAVSGCITVGAYGPDEDGDIDNDSYSSCYAANCLWFFCNLGLYVATSIIMLSGCWRFGSQFPMENIGVSFYLCLCSFLLIWLMILIFLCDHLCKKKSKDGFFNTLVQKIYADAF